MQYKGIEYSFPYVSKTVEMHPDFVFIWAESSKIFAVAKVYFAYNGQQWDHNMF